MVYGVIRLINFAHGELFMAGAFAGYFVLRDAGIEKLAIPQPWPIVVSYLAALAAGAFVAATLAGVGDRVCYRPIRGAGRIAALLTAVGLSLLLQNLARQWDVIGPTQRPWPAPRLWAGVADVPAPSNANYYEIRTFRSPSGQSVDREKLVVAKGQTMPEATRQRLAERGGSALFRKGDIPRLVVDRTIVVMLGISTIVLWFLVRKTRMGKAMRAVSEDIAAARLMGVNANRVIAATFFLGAFLAGLGGVAFCTKYGQADPLTGFMPGLKAFIAAVLGGIGSIPGAVVGALLLGVSEDLLAAYVSTDRKDALAFVRLVLVLLVRPTGLLGRAQREKV